MPVFTSPTVFSMSGFDDPISYSLGRLAFTDDDGLFVKYIYHFNFKKDIITQLKVRRSTLQVEINLSPLFFHLFFSSTSNPCPFSKIPLTLSSFLYDPAMVVLRHSHF